MVKQMTRSKERNMIVSSTNYVCSRKISYGG